MARVPPAVAAGLISQQDLDYLVETAQSDPATYYSYARELCQDNHLLFGHIFLKLAVPPHMAKIVKKTQGRPKVMCKLPRDHAKTKTSVEMRLVHTIAYRSIGLIPRRATLLLKESADEAEDKVRTILGTFETNKDILNAFGNVEAKARIWNTKLIVLERDASSDHPTLYASGMGSAVTGKHPDELLCDDMVSVKNSMTPHLRQQRWTWWSETIEGTIGPTCRVWNNYTPYYADDLNARLLETGAYYNVEYAALPRMPTGEDYELLYEDPDDPNLITGVKVVPRARQQLQALWPCPDGECPMTMEHFEEVGLHRPLEWLLLKHAQFPHSFPKSYMNVLTSLEEIVITPWSFNLWSNDPTLIGTSVRSYMEKMSGYPFAEKDLPGWFREAKIISFPLAIDVRVAVHAWDHAISRKKNSKRTAVCQAYRTGDNKVFLMHYATRVGFMEGCRIMLQRYKTDPIRRPVAIVSEGINFQASYQDFLSQTSDEMLPVEDVGVQANKAVALSESGTLSAMQQGQIFFQAENVDALKEHLDFTSDGKGLTDQVDATRMAFERIRKSFMNQPVYIPIRRRSLR